MPHWHTPRATGRMIVVGAALVLVLPSVRAVAQEAAAAPLHVVAGTVYDSVAHAPLAGAVVQLARIVGADSTPRIVTSRADDAGHYRIAGLPNGRYAIGFQHDALNALGIESPLRAFELRDDSAVAMNLAIGSGAAVRMQRCGDLAGGPAEGMLAGYVRDARGEAPVAGAQVELHWLETAVQRRGLRTVDKHLTSLVSSEGAYVACGVPSDAPLDIAIRTDGFRPLVAQLSIPAGGAMRQDFVLADSSTLRGAGAIAGRVTHDSTPLASGQATIAALGIDVPVHDGAFTMAALPAGTWFVELKGIGVEPAARLVTVSDRATTNVIVAMNRKAQSLETVNVVGKASRELRVLDDIALRNRVASGTVFLPGNSWLAAADTPADVLRAARGFIQVSPTRAMITGCGGSTPVGGDKVEEHKTKNLVVYLDGERLGTGLQGLADAVQMRDVLAIETYPDVQFAPFLWRTNDACAVMAVWTRR
ncbi:MAG: carboxypeptidase regulatory-like domain-containing protein [bacterium]